MIRRDVPGNLMIRKAIVEARKMNLQQVKTRFKKKKKKAKGWPRPSLGQLQRWLRPGHDAS